LAVDEDPEDDRNTYYCARELFFNGLTEAAIDMFKRHLDMPTSNWMPERAWSMRYLAKLMPEMREVWLLRAVAEYDSRETWLDLSHHYYKCGNWLGSLFAAVSCLKHEVRPNFYLNEPEAWSYLPWDLAAIAAYNLQMFDHAVSYGIKALELEPSNDRLKQNLFFYQKGGNFAVGHDIL
jgi:tetratricopeptide (TPR) repeat protein